MMLVVVVVLVVVWLLLLLLWRFKHSLFVFSSKASTNSGNIPEDSDNSQFFFAKSCHFFCFLFSSFSFDEKQQLARGRIEF